MAGRAFVAGLTVLASALAYLVVTAAQTPALQYLPLTHQWTWNVPPGVIGMDWFFRAGVALLAGGLGFGVGRVLVARTAWARRPASARFVFGLGFALMLWGALFMIFALVTTPRARTPGGPLPETEEH
jgi:hypothetical protein